MADEEVIISFSSVKGDEGNRLAGHLREELSRSAPDATVQQRRESPENMDLGATLVIVLGSAAVTAIAKGIATFIAKYGKTIDVSTKDGHYIARGIDSRDAAEVARALAKLKTS